MASNNFKHIAANTTPIWQHYNQPQQEQNIPTVLPVANFDARADADAIHKAMKGFGTNEKILMAIMCHRSSAQRSLIAQAYKSGYEKDLESKFKSELSGNFERVMVSLCLPTCEFLAREMYEAMKGLGTNNDTLIEFLCSSTIQQMREGQRDEDHLVYVDEDKVKSDVFRLYEAGESRLGTDESTFNSILSTRSWTHLCQVMAKYQLMYGHSLAKAIHGEFSGNTEKVFLGILQCAQNRLGYFARRLKDSMNGLGTHDRSLIRNIVSHCDVDLGNIQKEYTKMFAHSLESDIVNDTSGAVFRLAT